jgi:hypothetical protein
MRGRRLVGWRAVAPVALAVVALGAGGAVAALSPSEKEFAKAYEKLVPSLNAASAALISAVDNSAKDTDAQVATIFAHLAERWATATKPLLVLHAPAPEARIFAVVSTDTRAVERDLLAVAQAGRTDSVPGAKRAGRALALDFNGLGTQIKKLKARLGLH